MNKPSRIRAGIQRGMGTLMRYDLDLAQNLERHIRDELSQAFTVAMARAQTPETAEILDWLWAEVAGRALPAKPAEVSTGPYDDVGSGV